MYHDTGDGPVGVTAVMSSNDATPEWADRGGTIRLAGAGRDALEVRAWDTDPFGLVEIGAARLALGCSDDSTADVNLEGTDHAIRTVTLFPATGVEFAGARATVTMEFRQADAFADAEALVDVFNDVLDSDVNAFNDIGVGLAAVLSGRTAADAIAVFNKTVSHDLPGISDYEVAIAAVMVGSFRK